MVSLSPVRATYRESASNYKQTKQILKQEDHKFAASRGYMHRPRVKTNKNYRDGRHSLYSLLL